MIGDIVKVIVDRPLGSQHPQYKETYYPINYGFVEGIMAEDIEEKWVVVPLNKSYTKEEIKKQVEFQEKYFKSGIIM